jgi:hypothetical protein
LCRDIDRLPPRQRPGEQAVGQTLTVDQLHDQIRHVTAVRSRGLPVVIDLRDVWVSQAGRRARLRTQHRIARHGGVQHLDRHGSIQHRILGQPHLGHPTRTDELTQRKAIAQPHSGNQRHAH